MANQLALTGPANNAAVTQSFTAQGTWQSDIGNPMLTVTMERNGQIITSNNVTINANGTWTATFSNVPKATGYTCKAIWTQANLSPNSTGIEVK